MVTTATTMTTQVWTPPNPLSIQASKSKGLICKTTKYFEGCSDRHCPGKKVRFNEWQKECWPICYTFQSELNEWLRQVWA